MLTSLVVHLGTFDPSCQHHVFEWSFPKTWGNTLYHTMVHVPIINNNEIMIPTLTVNDTVFWCPEPTRTDGYYVLELPTPLYWHPELKLVINLTHPIPLPPGKPLNYAAFIHLAADTTTIPTNFRRHQKMYDSSSHDFFPVKPKSQCKEWHGVAQTFELHTDGSVVCSVPAASHIGVHNPSPAAKFVGTSAPLLDIVEKIPGFIGVVSTVVGKKNQNNSGVLIKFDSLAAFLAAPPTTIKIVHHE